MHRLMKATKRESHPVNLVTSNSKDFSVPLSPKDCLMGPRPGKPLRTRQLPENKTRKTPGDVRSTTRFGLEAVSVTGFVQYGIMPTAWGGNPFNLDRAPGLWVVFIDWGTGAQNWINDTPGFLDVILTREQGRIARHCVTQHPFVGIHLLSTG